MKIKNLTSFTLSGLMLMLFISFFYCIVFIGNDMGSVELYYAKVRIKEKGWSIFDLWLRKQVMNFNDGTFSWFQEGFFHAWDYPDIAD